MEDEIPKRTLEYKGVGSSLAGILSAIIPGYLLVVILTGGAALTILFEILKAIPFWLIIILIFLFIFLWRKR